MKIPSTLFAIVVLAAAAHANDNDSGTALVPNNHGGFNVVQPGARPISIPFFGSQGYAARVAAESHSEKPKFILKPVVQDVGHGNPHIVYKKIHFATAEEAEAVRLSQ